MPYVPNPTNAAEPLDSEAAGTAAAEFRALKGRVNTLAGALESSVRNRLINGAFIINQRDSTSIADDVYGHDRWYALTQTGNIFVSNLYNEENGTPFMARLAQTQATAQRMGYAQIIESINCTHLRGQTVTFRVNRVRLTTTANIRMAVLEWTGAADVVTSDVVLNWTSGTYTAGNFFLASDLTVSSVVQQALTANAITNGSAVTVTLGSSFNNLIVLVWTESAVAQSVCLDLGKAQLEIGSAPTVFEPRPISLEELLCSRFCLDTRSVPAGVTTTSGGRVGYQFAVPMRITPSFIYVSGGELLDGIASYTVTGATASPVTSNEGARVDFTAVGTTAGRGCIVPGARVRFEAEL